MNYNFNEDLALSHRYEIKFADFLYHKGVKDIELAPQDKIFEDWDVKSGPDTYEIKYDRWFAGTKNVLIETYSTWDEENNNSSMGWFFKTKAKWLIVFYNDFEFYGIDMGKLRDDWYNKPNIWKRRIITQATGRKTVFWLTNVDNLHLVKFGDIRK